MMKKPYSEELSENDDGNDPFLDLCTDLGSEQKATLLREIDITNQKTQDMKAYIQDVLQDRLEIVNDEREILKLRSGLTDEQTDVQKEKNFQSKAFSVIDEKFDMMFDEKHMINLKQELRDMHFSLENIRPDEALEKAKATQLQTVQLQAESDEKKRQMKNMKEHIECIREQNAIKLRNIASEQAKLQQNQEEESKLRLEVEELTHQNDEKARTLVDLQASFVAEIRQKELEADQAANATKSHVKGCEIALKEHDQVEQSIAYCLEQKEFASDMLTKMEAQKQKRMQARLENEETYMKKTMVETKLGELTHAVAKLESDKLKYQSKLSSVIENRQGNVIALEMKAGPLESERHSLLERQTCLQQILSNDSADQTITSEIEKLQATLASLHVERGEWSSKYQEAMEELAKIEESGTLLVEELQFSKAEVKELSESLKKEVDVLEQERKTLHKKISKARTEYKRVVSHLEEERKANLFEIVGLLDDLEKNMTTKYSSSAAHASVVLNRIILTMNLSPELEDLVRQTFTDETMPTL